MSPTQRSIYSQPTLFRKSQSRQCNLLTGTPDLSRWPDTVLDSSSLLLDQHIALVNQSTPLKGLVNQDSLLHSRLGFWYDAVMSIGLGACHALPENRSTSTEFSGANHGIGIRSVDFEGASGRVQFRGASRNENTVPFMVGNLIPSNDSEG